MPPIWCNLLMIKRAFTTVYSKSNKSESEYFSLVMILTFDFTISLAYNTAIPRGFDNDRFAY